MVLALRGERAEEAVAAGGSGERGARRCSRGCAVVEGVGSVGVIDVLVEGEVAAVGIVVSEVLRNERRVRGGEMCTARCCDGDAGGN